MEICKTLNLFGIINYAVYLNDNLHYRRDYLNEMIRWLD